MDRVVAEKHIRDIVGILKISADQVDSEYMNRWIQELDLHDAWEAVQQAIEASI